MTGAAGHRLLVQCRVCSHAQRAELEAAGDRGANPAELAALHGLNENAVARHLEKHPRAPSAPARSRTKAGGAAPAEAARKGARVRPAPAKEGRAPSPEPPTAVDELEDDDQGDEDEAPITSRSPTSATTARARVERLIARLERMADTLPKGSSVQDRIAVVRAMTTPLRLLGQFTGELGASDATVAASPHYRRLRTAIVETLRDFPDALRAVERALSNLEPGARATEDEDEAAA